MKTNRLLYSVFYLLLFFQSGWTFAQINATFSTTLNTNCNGSGCSYEGPSILINELMISPINFDGSISGFGGVGEGRGEWIELYNPNLCEPVDISCYYLGNYTAEGSGGYVIPSGTIIPPAGFCLIRGGNAAPLASNLLVQNGGNVVEIVVPYNITDPGVCAGGTRLWFPNAGGWFAFYDNNGVAQDAVSWASSAGTSGSPCIPVLNGCTAVAALSNYDQIPMDRKNYISSLNASNHLGNSLRRAVDGGIWSGNGAATYAICNGPCATPSTSTCTGTATVTITGGTAPYSFLWDDSEAQSTQTASELCEGMYTVTVTDNAGIVQNFSIEIFNFIPTVTVSIQDNICIDGAAISPVVSPIAGAGQTGILSGNGIVSTTFEPATANIGTHSITYLFEDEFGCSNSAVDNITVNPLPIVTIGNNASPYCLSAIPANLILTPAGGILSGNGVTNNNFIPLNAGVGTHTLTYTFTDGNGCVNSTTIAVTVVGLPAPILTIPATLCIDAAVVTLAATPVGGTFTINSTASNDQFLPATYGVGAQNVTYQYIDSDNCIGTATGQIQVTALPSLDIAVASFYCFETGQYPIAGIPAGGTFTGNYVVGNNLDLSAAPSGSQSLSYAYTDALGCSNSITENYYITFPIQPNFAYTTDCFQNATLVSLAFDELYTYNWQIEGQNVGTNVAITAAIENFGLNALTLTIADEFGCIYDTMGFIDIPEGVTMKDFVVPNIITPNGDGINDFLEISDLFNACFEIEIDILNRWGNVVYVMDGGNIPFNGKSKSGDILNEGVYFYAVRSKDFDCSDEKYQGYCYGSITVVR